MSKTKIKRPRDLRLAGWTITVASAAGDGAHLFIPWLNDGYECRTLATWLLRVAAWLDSLEPDSTGQTPKAR
jgi:hypothetical protein